LFIFFIKVFITKLSKIIIIVQPEVQKIKAIKNLVVVAAAATSSNNTS